MADEEQMEAKAVQWRPRGMVTGLGVGLAGLQ